MTPRFSRVGKQVLVEGKHYADAKDEAAAETIVSALNHADSKGWVW